MKSFLQKDELNALCSTNVKCILSSCCSQDAFKSELFLINSMSLLLITLLGLFITYRVLNSERIVSKFQSISKNVNQKLNSVDAGNSYSTFLTTMLKFFILNFLIMRLIEIIYIDNFLNENTNRKIEFLLSSIIELVLIITSIYSFYIAGQYLEFYKRYLLIITIYTYILLSKSYDLISFIVIFLIISTSCLLLIITYWVFFSKLNRDHLTTQRNFNFDIMETYSQKLVGLDNISLYRETKRVFEMYKILEIVESIRVNRKHVMNIGLVLIFVILGFTLIGNIYIVWKAFSITRYGLVNSIINDVPNYKRIELNSYSDNTNLLFVILSDKENETLENNKSYIDFMNRISREKSGRFYSIIPLVDNNNPFLYITSLFTGTKLDFTGQIEGNIEDNVDSVFRTMESHYMKFKVLSNKVQKIFRLSENHVDQMNDVGYSASKDSDENKFQSAIEILNQKQTKLLITQFQDSSLESKMHYIQSLYNNIDEDTILILTTDSFNASKPSHPLLIAKKNSNFADAEFSLYPKTSQPTYHPQDITSTITALLYLNTPAHNQGHFIDEIVQLKDYRESDRKMLYLDLRQQVQNLNYRLLSEYSKSTGEKFLKEFADLSVAIRDPSYTEAEFYDSEIKNFNKLMNHVFSEVYSIEASRNDNYCKIIFIFLIFVTLLMVQYVTFADIAGIFSLSESFKRNTLSIILAFTVLLAYYIVCIQIEGKDANIETDNIVIYIIVIPFIIANIFHKIIDVVFFYAGKIESVTFNKVQNFTFFNIISDINSAILTEKGLAYIYLFRIYSVISSMVLSLILFTLSNSHLFLFSSEALSPMLIFKETDAISNIQYKMRKTLILVVYQFYLLLTFYNYPSFNKNKQIFDSIFILYDMKLGDGPESQTCERQAFDSTFVKICVNFDTQSELYYKHKHFWESAFYPKFSDKLCTNLILWKILNTKETVSKLEKNVKYVEDMQGMANHIMDQIRRTSIDSRI